MDLRRKIAILAVLLLGLVPRLLFLRADPDTAMSIVQDDAFYYIKTATHIVSGSGSTFDGMHPTNGYHPLWMAMILPLAALIRQPWTLMMAVIALGILMNLLTAAALYRLLRRSVHLWYLPAVGVALYYFNPRVVQSSLNAMETSLNSLLFVLALSMTILRQGRCPSDIPRHRSLLALVLAFLFLARTDNVFTIAILLFIALREERSGLRLRTAAGMLALMGVLVSPWLLWNKIHFGGFMQESGMALAYAMRMAYAEQGHGPLDMLLRSASLFTEFLTRGIYEVPLGMRPATFWFIAIFCILAFAVRWRDSALPGGVLARRQVWIVAAVALAFVPFVFVHSFIRWAPREYYFDPAILILALAAAFALDFFEPGQVLDRLASLFYGPAPRCHRAQKTAVLVLAAAILFLCLGSTIRTIRAGRYHHQPEMYTAALYLRQSMPEHETAAAFNAGIIGFFSERRVVNIDGVINSAAFQAIRERRLFDFLREAGVDIYVDYHPYMLEQYAPFLGAESDPPAMIPVIEIDRPEIPTWCGDNIHILRLQY